VDWIDFESFGFDLAHSASFHSKENNAPSKPGIKHQAHLAANEGHRLIYQTGRALHQLPEPFGANAIAFMARESVVWPINPGLAGSETVPVCPACTADKEQADATLAMAVAW
jgi:hypothetical protein